MEENTPNPLRSRIYSCTDLTQHASTTQRRSSMPQLLMRSQPSSCSVSFYDSMPSTPCGYHYPEQTLESVRQQALSSSRKSSEESTTSTEMPTWAEIKSQYQLVTQLLDVVADPDTVALERKRALKLWTRKIMQEKEKQTVT